MNDYPATVLRAVVRAAVIVAGLGVTASQADDLARRLIAADQPEITTTGEIRLVSGEPLSDALARHKQTAPHLFQNAEDAPQDDVAAVAKRARLKRLKAADRLGVANGDQGLEALG